MSTNQIIGFMKLDPNAIIPTKAHEDDLGFDLYTSEPVSVKPHSITKIPTGIAVQFPKNVGGIIKDRSSIATKTSLQVVAGVIDCSYQGELIIAMANTSDNIYNFDVNTKIAQMILIHSIQVGIVEITKFDSVTTRQNHGFGSTGI